MTTPNKMPRKHSDKVKMQIVDGLISLIPSSWDCKSISKDKEGKEVIETRRTVRDVVRYPLAQNVSDLNVERAAKKLL